MLHASASQRTPVSEILRPFNIETVIGACTTCHLFLLPVLRGNLTFFLCGYKLICSSAVLTNISAFQISLLCNVIDSVPTHTHTKNSSLPNLCKKNINCFRIETSCFMHSSWLTEIAKNKENTFPQLS